MTRRAAAEKEKRSAEHKALAKAHAAQAAKAKAAKEKAAAAVVPQLPAGPKVHMPESTMQCFARRPFAMSGACPKSCIFHVWTGRMQHRCAPSGAGRARTRMGSCRIAACSCGPRCALGCHSAQPQADLRHIFKGGPTIGPGLTLNPHPERQGKEGAALDAAVSAAAKSQAAKATTQDVVLAQEIATAPAAELASGDGDVSTTGAARGPGRCVRGIDSNCRVQEIG